jgi:protoheme IX farnesyltransferase
MNPLAVEDPPLATRRAVPVALEGPPEIVRAQSGTLLADIGQLVKVRVSLLVLLTTLAGFVLGSRAVGRPADPWLILFTIVGTALVAASASVFNQILEKDRDARMDRTRDRPLPAGRLTAPAAVCLGVALVLAGLALLLWRVGGPAAVAALVTFVLYVAVYTPLKPITHLSTVIGAVPGALPPLIGWIASGAPLDGPAWILFGILFFWQLPHFLAIAWLYREDYARGGFPLLTVVDPRGAGTARQVLTNSLALLTVSLLPAVIGQSSPTYFWSALGLGCAFLAPALWLAWRRTDLAARWTVLASVAYLPLLLIALVLDSTP